MVSFSEIYRLISEPDRFGRFIDATFFEDLIDIICNPKLYNSHFEEPLKNAFVLGREQARVYLFKIKDIRNFLSHSNHITNRQAEQLSCYSKDVIDSIKIYFQAINKEKEFNVPSIRTFKDSEGSNIFSSQFLDLNTHKYIDLKSVNLY
ncbi:hypothetical protein ACFSNA_02715 [Pedobacter mendelii]|uniref:hypothetical protein n=1 Tax=Pedobacter mendelii TaxID=1908240 RepID=UPI00361F5D85